MTHQITISGKPYDVEARYAEGHVLTANEASALNQTFFENLRNNFASRAKEGEDQTAFNEYAASYQFGVRTGGGGSRDPVESEAMNMARDTIKATIKKAGKNVSDFSAKSISEAAVKLLDKDPTIRELAKKRVEEMQSNASAAVDDDLLSSLEPAAPAETDTDKANEEAVASTPAATRKGKGSADAEVAA